jgi:2,4-dienoyl-CoA reductase-like NADH-dependent reductase (Old Yellow Enzyme family)
VLFREPGVTQKGRMSIMSIMFEPVTIKNLKIRNRIARSATFEGMGNAAGEPSERHARLYSELAEAGVGLIFTSAAMVERFKLTLPEGQDIAYPIFIDRDELVELWKPIVAAVQSRGARIAMQIVHPGREEDPGLRLGEPPVAPSPVELPGSGVVPREMTPQEIREMAEKFAQACRRVKEAGFDAVQLHGGHGYMINNFISPYTNQRSDEYGGDTARRARFIVDIVRRAREFVGNDYPIMIKMNCDDFVPGGLVSEEAARVASVIEAGGIDCIEVTGGMPESRERMPTKGINKQEKEAYLRPYAEALRPAVSIPLILVGGMRSPRVIEKILSDGTADMVSMSRPFIREPRFLERWKQGDRKKATCVSCAKCAEHVFSKPLRCYVEEAKKRKKARRSAQLPD